ncbi:MAG: transcription termination/antitermination protein NusG [Aggregatilineales bacterium]
MLSPFDPEEEARSETAPVDYDPDPVYLDEEKPTAKKRRTKKGAKAALPPEEDFDILPALSAERVTPQRVFVSGHGDGEGVQITVDDEKQWYVIHCYSGYENKVRQSIEQRINTMGMQDKIFDVVVPTQEEIEIREGKRKVLERRVFPGYLLVLMKMDEDSWYVVRNTPGVTGFIGMGNEPTALRPEEVGQIMQRMEADAATINIAFKLGDKVRIIDGPFNDFSGQVDHIDMEKAKVRVMVSFFGRETPVELDFLQVEKVSSPQNTKDNRQ